jgi:hypothetical protein
MKNQNIIHKFKNVVEKYFSTNTITREDFRKAKKELFEIYLNIMLKEKYNANRKFYLCDL